MRLNATVLSHLVHAILRYENIVDW